MCWCREGSAQAEQAGHAACGAELTASRPLGDLQGQLPSTHCSTYSGIVSRQCDILADWSSVLSSGRSNEF